MTTYYKYSTIAEAHLTTCDNMTLQTVFGHSNLDTLRAWAESVFNGETTVFKKNTIVKITFKDVETGKILLICENDEIENDDEPFEGWGCDDPFEDWGYDDEDIGYDPYLGCYTDDC